MNKTIRIAALGLLLVSTALAGFTHTTAASPPLAGAGDWPMYGHDASRTNYNPAEKAINSGNAGQLVSRWQAHVGSNATTSSGAPSVAGGRVYVPSSAPRGPNFFAFDAVSGAAAWSTNLGYQDTCFNVGIGATPSVAGNIVVAGGGDGSYYGLDANSGGHIWQHAMGAGPTSFPWASPLVVGNRAYIGISSRCDNPSVRGEIRELDLGTGSVTANRYFMPAGQAGAGIWNSPALSPDGGTLVVATGEDFRGDDGPYNRAIITLNPNDLSIRQVNKQGTTSHDLDYGTTPLVFHDKSGRVLIAAVHKNGTLYAYSLTNVSAGPAWQRATGVTVGMMPAYDPNYGDGGTLFVAAAGRLYALDPADGSNRWGPVGLSTSHGNLAVANGLIFANTGAGGVLVFDETSGRQVAALVPANKGIANSGVVVANGMVYWLSGAYLNAWGLPSAPQPTPTPKPTGPTYADPAFARLWTRTDQLVAAHMVNRSWFWGPAPFSPGITEPYSEGKGGSRLVQYFDKSRMEINNPNADKNSAFYVTNGLLVIELISGREQVGDSSYVTRLPSKTNIAGDLDDTNAPTYSGFAGVSNTTLGDHKATDLTGRAATATISRDGTVGNDPGKTVYTGLNFVHYEAGTGHNIPAVFWDFLNARGTVIENGQSVQAQVISPWFYASGLPISEPYWSRVKIAGKPTDVLIQAFERRVLTYTPANADPFKVEMGNVGRHYFDWRYPNVAP
ncbi:MAG: PQQ-binding-like beta-propeller repeat protein [Chloroflexia bacterium]